MNIGVRLLDFLSPTAPGAKATKGHLLPNPYAEHDYQAEQEISGGTAAIHMFIDKNLVDRPDWTNVLRASAASMCVRRRALQHRGIAGHRTPPRSIENFILGELHEYVTKWFILKADVGVGRRYSEVRFGKVLGSFPVQGRWVDIYDQIEVTTKIEDLVITGHLDGMGRRNSDAKWELIEVKSASDYSYHKFKHEGPGDYLKQSTTLMMSDLARAFGISDTNFFFGRKQTGHRHDRIHRFDPRIAAVVEREFQDSVAPELPPPPFSLAHERKNGVATGRMVAPAFPCAVCPYINTPHCHSGMEKKLTRDRWGNKKPVYVKDLRAGR